MNKVFNDKIIGYLIIKQRYRQSRRNFKWLKINLNKQKVNLKETVGNVTDNKDLEKKVKTIKLLVKPKKQLKTLK